MHFSRSLYLLWFVVVSVALSPLALHAQSEDTRPSAIKWSGDGLKLELQAMPLDLVRAFFLGRGFPSSEVEFIAKSGCVFRSAMGNSGVDPKDPSITVELAKWKVIRKKGAHAPRTRENWARLWKGKNISKNAKTAFHWALYPTRQTYQSTDYNWGMISFALSPGEIFDLEVVWLKDEAKMVKLFKQLECGR